MTRFSACQLTLILGLALGAAGCSTIADLDPTGLIGGSSNSTPDSQFPDAAPSPSADQNAGTTPDLASLPARPAPAATPGQQQQTAQSLASDGAQARYSGDALRGGTEAAAPPPAASDTPPSAAQSALGLDAPPTASDAAPTAEPAPQVASATPPPQPASVPAGAEPAVTSLPNVQTAAIAPSARPVGPSSAAPGGAEPAVPANTPMRGGSMMAQPVMSDAALGFQHSSAPPLDPSVSQFVSAPIVAHYQQTASNAGVSTVSTAPAVPAVAPARGKRAGMGGPDMSGAVVANLDAISGASGSIAAMNGGVTPTAVVYFPGDGTSLSVAARAQVRAAAAAFKADGGQGTIRVVGHSSSRTANMPVERHLETIFEKSQARANAVAQELIHEGVPAARVLIDAVGDSQPIYFESMPQGEDGNRRAEIFVQS